MRNSKELIYRTRSTRGNTLVSYSCKGTISWQLRQLITMFVPHITRKIGIETEFCEFSPELEDHFKIFEQRYKLSKLPRNSSFARVRNRCISMGRPRFVYEFFRISRIVFHGLASRGPLMGIKKSSW